MDELEGVGQGIVEDYFGEYGEENRKKLFEELTEATGKLWSEVLRQSLEEVLGFFVKEELNRREKLQKVIEVERMDGEK